MNYKKIYLKITTIPNQLEVDMESKEIEIFRNKYEAHKNFIKDSDVELAYLNESAVNGSFAKIYSVTLGFIHEGTPVVKTMYGNEKSLLDKLLSVLRQEEFKNSEVIMYNRSFILSFISKRLRKHNYSISSLPVSMQVYDKKPWTIKGSKCIQDYVKGIGYQTENFSETCFIHDIDADVIEGSDVARLIKKERFDEVHQSDTRYVRYLIKIDRQLSEEDELGKESVVIEEIGAIKKEPINVLDHLLASSQLSTSAIDAIVQFQKDSGEPAENVFTLVKTAMSKERPYNKVPDKDLEELKERLSLTVDYSLLGDEIKEKGNIGAKEAKIIVNRYKNKSKSNRKEAVELAEKFLKEFGKSNQPRAKKALEFIKEELLK